MELSEYHGGAQQGNLRIPEGRHGSGWIQFGSELRKYFPTKLESGVSEQAGVETARPRAVPKVEPQNGSNENNLNPKTVKEKQKSWERKDNGVKIARSKSQKGSQKGFKG